MGSLVSTSAPNIALIGAAQGLAVPFLLRLVPESVPDRLGVVQNAIMTCSLPFLLWSCMHATYSLSDSMIRRWDGTTDMSVKFMEIYISVNFFQSVLDLLREGSLKKKLPMLLHHVASIICYGISLGSARMHFYACLDGCCEASTVFLQVLNFGRIEGGVGEKIKKAMGPLWVVNGLSLWLSFIVFRLLLFPSWLYLFGRDLYQMPSSMRSQAKAHEVVLYPLTTVFLWGLSMQWFLRINAGLVKTIKDMLKKKGDTTKKDT